MSAAVTYAEDLPELLRAMKAIKRKHEGEYPKGGFVCSRAYWEKVTRFVVPGQYGVKPGSLFGLPIYVEETELDAKSRAFLLRAEGKDVTLLTS